LKHNKVARLAALVLMAVLFFALFTGCLPTSATPADSTDTQAAGGFGNYSYILMFVLLIAVFYFFLIRPENKKKKKLAEMRNELAVGDDITTIGGMVGKVCSIKDDLITFETGEDRVRIQITKWAISSKGTETTHAQK